MLSRAWEWFTSKWPFYPLKYLLLDEEIPGGASFAYTLGSALLIVFTLQVVSGIIQLFYYVPSVDHAYESVSYLRTEVPFGWLVHNMHHWGASIMIVLIALHMMRVYIWGAYKTQLTWIIGVFLVITVMTLTQTGTPLLWDQKGYWAGEVSTSIPGTVPFAGGILKKIIRGSETMSQLTLSRFFVIHVAVLVPGLAVLIGMHIASFRMSGPSGPWDERKRKKSGLFWPDQVFRDTIVATAVVFILLSLCVFFPPPFTGPADPSNTTYLPKPEWNFLFLYEVLKYFEGPLEPMGALGVPGLLITLLVLLPFIDRNPEKNPMIRPLAMVSLAVYAGFIFIFTVMGYLSPGFAQTSGSGEPPGVTGKMSPEPVIPETATIPGVSDGVQLFRTKGCSVCHGIHGNGGAAGPPLAGRALRGYDRAWLTDQIRDPKSHYPDTTMPAFTALSDTQVNSLVDYLLSLQETSGKGAETREKNKGFFTSGKKSDDISGPANGNLPGPAAYTIGSAANGDVLFEEHCSSCHGQAATGEVLNPGSDDKVVPPLNPIDRELFHTDPRVFARNIDRFIQHGSMPEGPHPAIHMLPFGDSHALTQQEIANIEAYVMKLNGVERAELIHPGMKPVHFFVVVASAFGFVILVLGWIWHRKFRYCD